MKLFQRKFMVVAAGIMAIAMTLASDPRPAQAAPAIYVDDNGAQCPTAAYTDIQSAVDAAMPGGRTIIVCAGLYGGPIIIDGARNLTLIGQPGAVVIPLTIPFEANLIEVLNSTNVTMQGFTLNGMSSLKASTGENYVVAIFWWFSSGVITDNTIINWHTGGWVAANESLIRAIMVGDNLNRRTTISDNTITHFQGVGIEVREWTRVEVTGNTLTTVGTGPDALFGMSIWSGYYGTPTGTISGNAITADAWPGDTETYGLHLQDASGFTITRNKITHWNFGIKLKAACPAYGYADNLRVTSNAIVETGRGIWLTADPDDGCGGDTHADRAQITGNTITNTDVGGIGILVNATGPNPPVGLIRNARVTGNTITNFLFPVYTLVSPGSTVTGRFSPNTVLP